MLEVIIIFGLPIVMVFGGLLLIVILPSPTCKRCGKSGYMEQVVRCDSLHPFGGPLICGWCNGYPLINKIRKENGLPSVSPKLKEEEGG